MPQAHGAELVQSSGRRGFGSLRIVNQTELDAVVTLAAHRASRVVYVAARREAALSGIEVGIYWFNAELGKGWRSGSGFARDRTHAERLEPLSFLEIQGEGGVQSDRYELILR